MTNDARRMHEHQLLVYAIQSPYLRRGSSPPEPPALLRREEEL